MAGFPPYSTIFPHPYASVAYLPASVTSASIPANQWMEHTSHDGRKYYYNTATQQTTWDKPLELKTTRELILSNCPWKEFKSDDGKPYYFNERTKQSIWVKPQEMIEAESHADSSGSTTNVTEGETKDTSVPLLDTPCTPATPKDDSNKPPEPSAIEKAMLATLASYDVPSASSIPDNIPIPPLPREPITSETRPVEMDRPFVTHQSRSPVPMQEYKTRGELAEGLRRLFRDCNVPGASTWEQALKLISADKRYILFKNFTEKKQIFNVYKTQKLKEEREEQRLHAKQAKEELERYLLRNPKLHSTMSYRKVDQLLSDVREWTVVPDREKRELFIDVMQVISKRERDEAKVIRKRNIKVFNEILSGMSHLTYRTTWSEAQQMLLDNPKFTGDVELQSLDKEDALVCFEEHICMLEQEHDEDKERERRRQKRTQRKNREAFIVLLDELHEQKMLTSTSLWKESYQTINKDDRFHKMLAQRGSTPLDLFKFYTEALKARYPAERKIIKEIIKDNGCMIDLGTSFEDFIAMVSKDERAKGIDDGNLRMSFDNLIEKAQGRERERQRDDARRLRKLEQNFCEMLTSGKSIGTDTTWEEIKKQFGEHPAFCALSLESERIRVYKDYLMSMDTTVPTDHDKYRRGRKEKRHKHETLDVAERRTSLKKKRNASSSPEASDASVAADGLSSKRKHRKSKKTKRKKTKHHKHHKSAKPGDDELEEGEAADDDEEEDEDEVGRRRERKRRRHTHSSDPEDGEEIETASDDDAYDKQSKRKHRAR